MSFTVQYGIGRIEGLVRVTESQYIVSLNPSQDVAFDTGENRIRQDVEEWLDANLPE